MTFSEEPICLSTIRISGFMDFVHSSEFYITTKHNVSKTGSVSVFKRGEGDIYFFGLLRKS
jgi:hypothetical protein